MRIEIEVKEDVCILRLQGRFVTGSNAEYERARAALEATGCRKVIIDCREASYLDSTGIGFVVQIYKRVKNSGGQFVLANMNRRVREVLELTTLDKIIPLFDEEQAALASLRDAELGSRATAAV
jgi:anti-sigma B factor antagonist